MSLRNATFTPLFLSENGMGLGPKRDMVWSAIAYPCGIKACRESSSRRSTAAA